MHNGHMALTMSTSSEISCDHPTVGDGIRGGAVLIDLAEAAVRRGARRGARRLPGTPPRSLSAVGVVVRVDDRHGPPRASSKRKKRCRRQPGDRAARTRQPEGTLARHHPGQPARRTAVRPRRCGHERCSAQCPVASRTNGAGVDVGLAVGTLVGVVSVPALRRSRGGGTRWASRVIGRSRDRRNAHQETDGDEAAQKHASATTAQWRPRRTRTGTANVRPHVRPISLVHPR